MPTDFDLICLSHLRWDFVFQRPQHLLTRAAKERRVVFFEEPIFDSDLARLETRDSDGVLVAVPHLPPGLESEQVEALQAELLDSLLEEQGIRRYVAWYYTPMALGFARQLRPLAVVYDCMDELSAFAFAPPQLRLREQELFRRADLVFAGGESLFEAKQKQHASVHLFPSSVDVKHFARAREIDQDPADQVGIGRPRLGYFGVIDERMDLDLLRSVAEARPSWNLVMVGPVVKIEESALPRNPNIHYLGSKKYAELPAYLAGWDVALLPFARNDSTRFISPTKTPEYLAAGKPVVSTPIRDVIRPYGEQGLVRIAETPADFVEAIEATLSGQSADWAPRVDAFLARLSWDRTWRGMRDLIDDRVREAVDEDELELVRLRAA